MDTTPAMFFLPEAHGPSTQTRCMRRGAFENLASSRHRLPSTNEYKEEIIATTYCFKCLAPCSANCCKSSCIRFPVLALLAIIFAACPLSGIAVKARPPCTSMRRTLATTSINVATYINQARFIKFVCKASKKDLKINISIIIYHLHSFAKDLNS